MENERKAVRAHLDVQFYAVAHADRRFEGGAAILDAHAAVQPAMSEGRGCQPGDALRIGRGRKRLVNQA
jgi:hypothetical protein